MQVRRRAGARPDRRCARGPSAAVDERSARGVLDPRGSRSDSVTGDPAMPLRRPKRPARPPSTDEVDDLGFYAYAVGEYARLAGDADDGPCRLQATRCDPRYRPRSARRPRPNRRVRRPHATTRSPACSARQRSRRSPRRSRCSATSRVAVAMPPHASHTTPSGSSSSSATSRRRPSTASCCGSSSTTAARRRVLARARASEAGATRLDRPRHGGLGAVSARAATTQAAASIDAARALGADDARLRFHEGAIRLARGDRRRRHVDASVGPRRWALRSTRRNDAEASTLLGE